MLNLLPIEWRVGLAVGGLVALLGGAGATGLYFHHRWYGDGYAAAGVKYEAEKAAQAAANRQAVNTANVALAKAADQLSMKGLELDDALAKIDASAGGAGGDALGLDARRVRDLGAVR